MGSCFSRRRADPPPTVRRYSHPDHSEEEVEETVKEVLSETPAIRYLDPTSSPDKPDVDTPVLIDEMPEVSTSEICSETLSTSTTTTTTATEVKKKKESTTDAVMTRKDAPPTPSPVKNRRKRSVSGELQLQVTKRDTSVGIGCRSGRTSPSPAKKMEAAVGRTYSAREVGSGKSRALQPPPGERSGRMPESPLVKHNAAKARDQKRSLSAPRTNGRASSPPRRARPPLPAEMSENRWGRSIGGIQGAEEEEEEEATGGGDGGEGKESLENPLVSLECFIFL